jgi:BirA family transcriptional regulator, biotin operon repressor / biotin---[acetyl-CoA-carboxylase] ligase
VSAGGGEAARLRERIASLAEAWPAPVEHHATLGSTSDRLKEWARAGAPDLAVVVSDAQSAGRGRQGRTWVSPPGNLYLSVLLRPAAGPAGLVPLLGGIAAAAALEHFGVEARLKWPNDLLVGEPPERKIAGVLAEGSSGPRGLDWVVLGIGANVDPQAPLPEGSTSLRHEAGRVIAPLDVAARILVQVRVWYHAITSGGAPDLLEAWRGRSVPWWGRLVETSRGDQVIRGIARGIDDDGALRLSLPDGRLLRVVSGEVHRVRIAAESPLSDRGGS